MNKLRLGIDIDGVVADFNFTFRKLVHDNTQVRLPEISLTYPDSWDYHRVAGVTSEEDNLLWEHIKNSASFWLNITAYPTAPVFLEWLAWLPSEIDVYFITSRPGKTAKMQTEMWLERNGWGYDCHPTVLISRDKGKCASALNLTHYIDDKNENCVDVLTESPKTKVFMLARPWNTAQLNIPRIDSLNVFRQVIKEDGVKWDL